MSDILKVKQKVQPLEALQYLGNYGSGDKIADWFETMEGVGCVVTQTRTDGHNSLQIQTLNCRLSAQPLDWIVRHEEGVYEVYPPHEFGEIFETVTDEPVGNEIGYVGDFTYEDDYAFELFEEDDETLWS